MLQGLGFTKTAVDATDVGLVAGGAGLATAGALHAREKEKVLGEQLKHLDKRIKNTKGWNKITNTARVLDTLDQTTLSKAISSYLLGAPALVNYAQKHHLKNLNVANQHTTNLLKPIKRYKNLPIAAGIGMAGLGAGKMIFGD